MNFDEIKNILEAHYFFGFTAHRDKYTLRYTFRSIRYFTILIIVNVIKTEPNKFGSPKLVSNMSIGKIKINDIDELMTTLNDFNKIHKAILFKKK